MELARVVEQLEQAYTAARDGCQAEIDRGHFIPGTTPELMRDPNGRYILLDALTALTALTNAKTALHQSRG